MALMAGWDIRLWPQASDRCLQSPHWGYTSIVHSVVAGTKYNKQYQISPRCKAQSWDKVDWWPAENRNTWILIFNRSFTLHEMTNHWTGGNPLTNTQSYVQQIFVAIKLIFVLTRWFCVDIVDIEGSNLTDLSALRSQLTLNLCPALGCSSHSISDKLLVKGFY